MSFDEYSFFNRNSGFVGINAYQSLRSWRYIEDYLNLQESFDAIYGYMGLLDLVDKDMADRFRSAWYKFKVTITRRGADFGTDKDVMQRAEICKRGLIAMKKYVDDHNLAPLPECFIYETSEKKHFGVVKDNTRIKMLMKAHEDVECFYTLYDLSVILADYKLIQTAKAKLVKSEISAEVVEIKKPKHTEEDFDEEIPF